MTVQRVLFVDDEDDIRTVAEMSLSMVGRWDVTLASRGDEALELAGTSTPDLILLDVMMPGLDGLETFRRLQANPGTADIPVILMTAKVQPREVREYLALGVRGVIPKPFDPMALPDRIRQILAGS